MLRSKRWSSPMAESFGIYEPFFVLTMLERFKIKSNKNLFLKLNWADLTRIVSNKSRFDSSSIFLLAQKLYNFFFYLRSPPAKLRSICKIVNKNLNL